MRISDWSSDVCSSDLTGRNGATGEALSLVSPEEGGLLNQIQRMLKTEIVMDTVAGFAPSKPIRLDAPIPKNGGGQRQGGQRPPGKPAHRAHGKDRKSTRLNSSH